MKHSFESLHVKVCRNALGVYKHASETMVKAEVGRYPLTMNIICNIYRYWQHILHSEKHSLVTECLRWAIHDHNLGHDNFVTRITSLFHSLELPQLITNATENTQGTNKHKIIKKLHVMLIQHKTLKYFEGASFPKAILLKNCMIFFISLTS